MIQHIQEENGGGFRRTPTQGIDPHRQAHCAYKDVQLPMGVVFPTGVEAINRPLESLPTEVPEEIKTKRTKSSFDHPGSREREYGYGFQRGEASKEKETQDRLRRDTYPFTYHLLQSEEPRSISSSFQSSATGFPALGTGNSGNSSQNEHLFSPGASPPLILAFLAIGLFAVSMIGVFSWRRVQYARGVGRADLVWLSAGGVRGFGGAGAAGRDASETKVRPKLWDLWTRSRDSEDDWRRKKREGKRRSEFENQEEKEQEMTWTDIMVRTLCVYAAHSINLSFGPIADISSYYPSTTQTRYI